MAIALLVGGVNFKSKLELTMYIRQLIEQYSLGMQVSEADKTFLESLFSFHPDAQQKLKAGIEKIEVRLDQYGHKHFFMYDRIGGSEDISWTKCVNNARAM